MRSLSRAEAKNGKNGSFWSRVQRRKKAAGFIDCGFLFTKGVEIITQTERLSSLPQIQERWLSAIVNYAGRHLTP